MEEMNNRAEQGNISLTIGSNYSQLSIGNQGSCISLKRKKKEKEKKKEKKEEEKSKKNLILTTKRRLDGCIRSFRNKRIVNNNIS